MKNKTYILRHMVRKSWYDVKSTLEFLLFLIVLGGIIPVVFSVDWLCKKFPDVRAIIMFVFVAGVVGFGIVGGTITFIKWIKRLYKEAKADCEEGK